MTKTKTFTCIRCGKDHQYEATPQDDELFEEPLICVKCYEEVMGSK